MHAAERIKQPESLLCKIPIKGRIRGIRPTAQSDLQSRQGFQGMHPVKRYIDIVFSLFLLIFVFPLLLIIAMILLIKLGRPVFFNQIRAGKDGKPFKIHKFRTMLNLRNEKGELLPDGMRLTRFGGFLRKTSFDELPEIVNVVKGNMSLVGPRPLLIRYINRYTPEQKKRLSVVPGITGLAQVTGRNALSWEERFKKDVWYIEHWSILLDLKILLWTIVKVIKNEGILERGGADIQEFWGEQTPADGMRRSYPAEIEEKQ